METSNVTTSATSRRRQLRKLGGTVLLGTSLLGCVDSMSLGGDPYGACLKEMTCSAVPIALEPLASGISARASSKLAPAWTVNATAQAMVKSGAGGVWLVSSRDSALVLVKVSELGELSAETVVAGLAPLPNTTSRGRITSATFHAKGPVVTVEWDHFSPADYKCPANQYGQSAESPLFPGVVCDAPTPQTFVFDETNLAAPILVDPCVRGSHDHCQPSTVLRSGDGESLLVVDNEWVKYQTLAGVVTTRDELPLDLWGLTGTTTSADSWALLAGGGISQGSGGGTRGLVAVRRGEPVYAVNVQGVDNSSYGMGAGLVFPGPVPGQLIAVVESSATVYTLGEPVPAERPGDLSVLRVEGEQLKSQVLFKREDYSPIRLLAADADPVGNAFLATGTGGRDAEFARTLTPLLCRAKPSGESACFELPAMVVGLAATRENVLFVRSSTSLSRFDVTP